MLRCLALLLFAVSSLVGARTPEWSGSAQVRVEITRRGNEWIADYQFDREYPVWVFPRTDVTRDDLELAATELERGDARRAARATRLV